MPVTKKVQRAERYPIARSPFSMRPTQREVARLLGESRDNLRRLVNYKEQFVQRRDLEINGKLRHLAYPESRLRSAHERLKFHLNKIQQPAYLFSPRRGKSQRDNAALHLEQVQYLTLDLKQFYPSTTSAMVRRWFINDLGMYQDVAGLMTHLVTIDDKVSFGSPLTPVLCTMVHRRMFDQIADICRARGLNMSLWVDDLTISGQFVTREVLREVRTVVRAFGLKTHKIKYRTGNRPVFITGIGVVGSNLVAPAKMNLKIKAAWEAYHAAQTDAERDACAQHLLTLLGTVRHIARRGSPLARRVADQMNSLRQKRAVLTVTTTTRSAQAGAALIANDAVGDPF
ncbi:Reverse transcriptase (RNA-dependent DNA polymerase) [Devosia enhydra]|uniref:Reverse transcriptase (RNA-dependent DNA polymerase) n=1 Tax=Devosia enhydra TaxID=665118 RepID=A0A1K2HW99_9HYPH|nr:reverse transcriptase family protein [Devosia enhydra]SFZ82891.1 Reverse transcriptase (RNA-dependent DNA polymerase) [Devosia enhydra]